MNQSSTRLQDGSTQTVAGFLGGINGCSITNITFNLPGLK